MKFGSRPRNYEHIFFFQTFIFGIRIYSAVSGSRSSEKYFVDFFLYMYNKRLRSSIIYICPFAHCNFSFFSFHNDIVVNGGPLSFLILKCTSNELQGIAGDRQGCYFQFSNLSCTGTTRWFRMVYTFCSEDTFIFLIQAKVTASEVINASKIDTLIILILIKVCRLSTILLY